MSIDAAIMAGNPDWSMPRRRHDGMGWSKSRNRKAVAIVGLLVVAAASTAAFANSVLASYMANWEDESGLVVELLAPLQERYKPGYAYYYENPEYYDAKNWVSVAHQTDRTRANDDGTLSEWNPGWFVAHRDSGYGKVIASLAPGDEVTINGVTYLVEHHMLIRSEITPQQILEMTESAPFIIQTCYSRDAEDGHLIWLAWGTRA